MNSRQRFHETMSYGNPDRVPLLNEGIREEVIELWSRQGFLSKSSLPKLFLFDNSMEVDLDFNFNSLFSKTPKTVDDLRQFESLNSLLSLSNYADSIISKLKKVNSVDNIVFLKVHSGFFLTMGVNNWGEFTNIITLLADQPIFVKEYLRIYANLTGKLLDTILSKVNVDAVIFSEPIGGNEGPLISPIMYEDFILESYKIIINTIKNFGIDAFILRTYANTKILIPSILKYGFNCLWACETNSSQINYSEIRKEFGKELRLIGGIDLDLLRSDKSNIKLIMENFIPALLEDGGYIPIADGRVRPDIPFDNYSYYRKLLQEIVISNA